MRKLALIFGVLSLLAAIANVGVILFNHAPMFHVPLAAVLTFTGVMGIVIGTARRS